MNSQKCVLLMVVIIAFLFPLLALAQVPMLINYQGKLTNQDGSPLEDGIYRMIHLPPRSALRSSVTGTRIQRSPRSKYSVSIPGISTGLCGSRSRM